VSAYDIENRCTGQVAKVSDGRVVSNRDMITRITRRGWLTSTEAPPAVILIRVAVGATFLSEGIQKFLFPDELGAGRFADAGIPAASVLAPLDAIAEIVCGVLLLLGLLTRLATLPMIVNMIGALAITKVPLLWGGSRDVPDGAGFWDFAHEARTDVAMLAGLLFLRVVGAGRWSLDARLAPTRRRG
jgi:putative oxidoreductase